MLAWKLEGRTCAEPSLWRAPVAVSAACTTSTASPVRLPRSFTTQTSLSRHHLHCCKYYVNRKPRASAKASYNLDAQRRLWDLLVQQTGAEWKLERQKVE